VSRLATMPDSPAARLIRTVGLSPRGPAAWGTAPTSALPGVYVIQTAVPYEAASLDLDAVQAWIDRVPTLLLDSQRPTAEALAERIGEFWIPNERVVYIGLAGTNLRSRVRGFFRTPLGDPRPHAGGHWLKTLNGLGTCSIWWAETDEPDRYESELLDAFATHARSSATGRAAMLVLPFANRQTAFGVRKPHGISGSTLPRQPGSNRRIVPTTVGTSSQERTGPSERSSRAGTRLVDINAALQSLACKHPSGRITAVEAAAELEHMGLLNDSAQRPGLPLRKMLRAGQIEHAYQEGGRWWFIPCASEAQLDS
jgi:hypothetical protein